MSQQLTGIKNISVPILQRDISANQKEPTSFFHVSPCLLSGVGKTVRTSRHVQESASRAAEPLLLLLYRQEKEVNLQLPVCILHLLEHNRRVFAQVRIPPYKQGNCVTKKPS